MSEVTARGLSNSFQDVRLVSLASWSKAAEIVPRDRGGPYVVLQEGYDPQDPSMSADEFVLGRSGKWLSVGLFYRLPVPGRREEFVFGTAGEVMQVLGALTSKVAVYQPGERGEGADAPAGPDDMAAAIRSGQAPGEAKS